MIITEEINKLSVLYQWKLPVFHFSTDGRNHKMMNHDMLSVLSCLTAYLGFSAAPLDQNSKCQRRHQEKASWSWSRCWNFPSSPRSVQCNALQCLLWKHNAVGTDTLSFQYHLGYKGSSPSWIGEVGSWDQTWNGLHQGIQAKHWVLSH